MSLKTLDTAKLPSPIGRFRDEVKKECGLEPPKLVEEYYKALAVRLAEERERVRRAVASPAAWQAERVRLRKDYQAALGPFPPAQVEIIDRGVVEKKDVRMRKILFSSHKDNWIPANIYFPKRMSGRLPAILRVCGHDHLGKVGIGGEQSSWLALNGYVVFTFDPVGQGERQLVHHDLAFYPASTHHNILGSKMPLAGASLAWFMVWETIAAVTAVQSLPEVDPERIGITGASGGGWCSVHAPAMDERIKVAVPAAAVSSTRHEVMAGDCEQTLFDMQRRGLHYPDFMGFLICPRPIFVVANSHDIASIQTTEYAVSEAARLYDIMGHKERIKMQVWDKGHAYDGDQLTEAMRWFNKWLKEKPDEPAPLEVAPENTFDIDELVVCRNENVFSEGRKMPGKVFWDFARERLCSRKDLKGFLTFLKDSLAPRPRATWRELDRFMPGVGTGKRICYSPEKGILLPAEILIPDRADGVTILVDECGRRDDLDWQIQCMSEGQVVFRPDLRGWGEVSPTESWCDWEGWAENLYGSRWRDLSALAQMTGRNLAFDRARDLLALIDVAQEIAPGKPITVSGRRQGALVALFAALADDRIKKLAMERYPASFRKIMETEVPIYRPEGNVQGLLCWGIDVPDLLAAYSGELVTKEPCDSLLRPMKG